VGDPIPARGRGVLTRVVREAEESNPVPARLNQCGTTRRLDPVARTGCGDSTVCQQSAGVGQRLPLVVESVVVRKRDRPHIDRLQYRNGRRRGAEEERFAGDATGALPAL
jgi:hypothetical protein